MLLKYDIAMISPVFSSHSHWQELKDYWILFRYLFLDEVMLYLLFIPGVGVDLIHVLLLAPRRVGRSCEGIDLMTSNLLNPCHLPVRNCFEGLYLKRLTCIGLLNWAPSWSPEGLPKQTRLPFLWMLFEWWRSSGMKPRSWKSQLRVFKRRLKS